jgi:hypothetical protein
LQQLNRGGLDGRGDYVVLYIFLYLYKTLNISNMYNCKYCNKSYENPKSIASHTKWCKLNPNRQIAFNLSEESELKRIKNLKKSNSDNQLIEKRKLGWKRSFELGLHKNRVIDKNTELLRRQKISNTMKKNPNAGGLREGSGRGLKGWYNGIWCDSSWELAWVIYQIEHGINFRRNTEGFVYVYDNKKSKYYPDFIVDDVFIEIKGRRNYNGLDLKTREKINQFKGDLKVLYQPDMKVYRDYVISKYGKNYTDLYDKK